MHKKSISSSLLLCALSAVACTMQASQVEEFMKERRERYIIEKGLGIELVNPFYKEHYTCVNIAKKYKAYLEKDNEIVEYKVSVTPINETPTRIVFTEKDVQDLCDCLDKYNRRFSSIDVKKFPMKQAELTKNMQEIADWQNEIYAYKAAVEADKQANK